MIQLIADSGSSKTDWRLLIKGEQTSLNPTSGINPFFVSATEIAKKLEQELLPQLDPSLTIEQVNFYGAGCSSKKNIEIVVDGLSNLLKDRSKIFVEHDLLAAARALCGHDAGIATILGTGSNSCVFDGDKITENILALGYVLGDEGSGAYIGNKFIGSFIRSSLPDEIQSSFSETFKVTPKEMLDQVYEAHLPNQFLAQFATFIGEHIENPYLQNLVYNAFVDFIKAHIIPYAKHKELPVHSVGSIAFHFKEILERAVTEHQLIVGKILKSPLEELVNYHSGANN